jgi:hypothetical protein
MERPLQKLNDLSRSSSPFDPDGTLIAVIEMSLSSWLVAGIVPGVERQPLKKLAVDESALLKLLHRWREEAAMAGCRIKRIAVAFEAGRDGFWLARWLRARVEIPGEVRRARWSTQSRSRMPRSSWLLRNGGSATNADQQVLDHPVIADGLIAPLVTMSRRLLLRPVASPGALPRERFGPMTLTGSLSQAFSDCDT